jgi:chromosome segregation protein
MGGSTRIKRLVLEGFKSFGKRTEFLFGDTFNCILGPNGSGKSTAPWTEVLLGDGSVVKIGDLVDAHLRNAEETSNIDDGVYCVNRSDLSVFTLNPATMAVEKRPIGAFVRRAGEPELYKLTTRAGKTVTVTGCHPVMVFKDGRVQSEVVGHLAPGAMIAAPRVIPFDGARNPLPDPGEVRSRCAQDRVVRLPAETSSAFGRWLGLTIGDGYVRNARVEFVNADKQLVDEWIALSRLLFNFQPPYVLREKRSYRIIYHTRKVPALLALLFEAPGREAIKSDAKIIPAPFMRADQETIAALLSGLIDTDGYVSKNVSALQFTSKNERLVDQVQLLLLRFGILSRKTADWKYAANTAARTKRKYYTLSVEGKEKLEKFTQIPIARATKRQRLYFWAMRDAVPNPNTDVLPPETCRLVRKLIRLLRIPVKPLKKRYPRLAAYMEGACRPSRDGIAEIVALAERRWRELSDALRTTRQDQPGLVGLLKLSRIPMKTASIAIGLNAGVIGVHWATGRFHARPDNLGRLQSYLSGELTTILAKAEALLVTLKTLCRSDIAWEEITALEKVPGTEHVYDLCIFGNHNFVANGLFVHNSNILDAICFVLGKSSSKSLRAERSSHLIYNGGKSKQPAKQAEVSIFFENSDKVFPLPEDEVKVTRIVRQSGDSIYKINGKTRTRQEVTELLGSARIDADGHNIILQGDIVRLVEMSPEERRQLVEEVAGVSVYEEKKQQAIAELERVDERLHSADITLRERGRQLDALKQEREQALKHKELTDGVKSHKATLLSLQAGRARTKLQGLEERGAEHRGRLEALNAELFRLREDIRLRKEERDRIQSEISAKSNVEQRELSRQVEGLKVRHAELKAALANAASQLQGLAKRREELAKEQEELGQSEKQLDAQRAALKDTWADLERQLAELGQRLARFKAQHGLDETGEIEQRITELDKAAEELAAELQSVNQRRVELIREKDKLDMHVQFIDTEIARMKEVEAEHRQELEQLRKNRESLKAAVLELNRLLKEDSQRALDLARLTEERRQLAEEQGKLEVSAAQAKQAMTGQMAVQKVLENRSRLGEIYGTVAELGQTESRYATALEAAAAQRIHSIIVEDDGTAGKAIKYLKSQRLGTATFLPLNKVRPVPRDARLKELADSEGVHGFAIDLITFDERFANAFSHVFGNTLVVDSIDVARRLGIGKARMVTMDGDLCEVSGVMHGGYRHKSAGVFKDKELAERLAKARERLLAVEGDMSAIEEARQEALGRITELRQKKATLEGDIIKAERALKLKPDELDASSYTKEELLKKQADVGEQLRALDDGLAGKNRMLADLKIEKTQLRAKLDERRSPDVLAELRMLEARRKELEEGKLRIEGELRGLDQRAGIERDAQGIAAALKEIERDEQHFTLDRKQTAGLLKAAEADLQEKEGQLERFQVQFKELFERQKQLEQEIGGRETAALEQDAKAKQEEICLNVLSEKESNVKAELARLEAEQALYEGVPLLEGSEEALAAELPKLEQQLAAIGLVNLRALSVYELAENEYKGLQEKRQAVETEKEDVLRLMAEIEGRKRELFMTTFTALAANFSQTFSQLTTKGATAELELESKDDPFMGGLRIKVQLAEGKFMDIRSLSGGEKTMTALAMLFAIQEYEPASFYVMDEVDAALDKGNSEKLASLIRKYSQRAQYVMITHNDAVMTAADIVYGITMKADEGMSKAVSLRMEGFTDEPEPAEAAQAPVAEAATAEGSPPAPQ